MRHPPLPGTLLGIAEHEELAYPRNVPEWVSMDEAARIIGCTREDGRAAARRSEIHERKVERKVHRAHPSLRRTSVVVYRAQAQTRPPPPPRLATPRVTPPIIG